MGFLTTNGDNHKKHLKLFLRSAINSNSNSRKSKRLSKNIKDDYIAFETRYNSTKESYDTAKEKLAQSEENIEIVKKAYSDVAGLLRIATANKESILVNYKESEKELKKLTDIKDGLKFEVENNFSALEETYQMVSKFIYA